MEVRTTARKTARKLLKMAAPADSKYVRDTIALVDIVQVEYSLNVSVLSAVDAVKLLSEVGSDQLVECVEAIADRPDLLQALLYCCDLRPLNMLVCIGLH